MKTIKFKAWDKINKKMINLRPMGTTISMGEHLCFGCEEWGHNYESECHATFHPNIDEDFELIQFTGLLDKNGKEIYEGDVVKLISEKIGEVVYHEERAAYIFHDINNFNELLYERHPYEIIGNIYENPELLK